MTLRPCLSCLIVMAVLPVALHAEIIPVNLGDSYTPGFDSLQPRSDGGEFVIAAPGNLMPGSSAGGSLQLFSLQRATGVVSVVSDLRNEVGSGYVSGMSSRRMKASRDLSQIAIAMYTYRLSNGVGGDAIWLKNRSTGTMTLVTRRPDGTLTIDAGTQTYLESIDASGRFVTFTSTASDLVPGDGNGHADVFLFDAQTGELRRLSQTDSGAEAALGGSSSSVSPDGQFVAFVSESKLVAADGNSLEDWYLFDRVQGTLRLISVGSQGEIATGVNASSGRWSDDSRYFSFLFTAPQQFNVDGAPARAVLFDRSIQGLRSLPAFLDVPWNGADNRTSDTVVEQIAPGGRYALVTSALLMPPPYGKNNGYAPLYLADLQTHELVRVDMLPSGVLPTTTSFNSWIIDDSAHVLFENRSAELGTQHATLMHDWRPPAPTDVEVTVEGPTSTFPPNTVPRYTVHITNRGTTVLDDVVFRRYVQRGGAGANDTTNCYTDCGVPPMAPGQSFTFSFDVAPVGLGNDATQRVQMDIRAQSLSRFDLTPANNRVVINAARSADKPGGGGGSGGGGGAFDAMLALLMLSVVGRATHGSRPRAQ
jgi:hypothetical protein